MLASSSATWQQLFGQDVFQFSFLLLSSTLVFQLVFSSGRTFFKSPNNAKPCSLCVMRRKTFNFDRQTEPQQFFVNLQSK